MDHSPANVIAQYLIDEDLLTDYGDSGDWKVYIGSLPDGKDADHDIVGCMNRTPVKDGRIMDGAALFHFGVQLLLRSTVSNTGWAKASALQTALAAVDDDQVTIDAVTYNILAVSDATGVVSLGQEEGTKRRWMFSTNFIATIKEV